MAHVSEIRSNVASFGGSSLIARFAELRAAMSTRFAQHRAYRTTLSELQSLSARELDDLGIHPENIRDVARQAAMN